jgi:hypothetical protein
MLGVERLEHRDGELVAPVVEQRPLPHAGACETGNPNPRVRRARLHPHHPRRLERAEQPAGVAGVQVEAVAERPYLAALGADLPEHPGLAERPVAGEEAVTQRTDSLGYGPVEAPHLLDARRVHSLTLVR